MRNGLRYMMFILASVCCMACVREHLDHEMSAVRFSVSQERGTKADPQNHIFSWGRIAVSAWTAGASSPDFMDREAVVLADDGWWEPENVIYWPSSGMIDFMAYAPVDAGILSADRKSLNYTVPSDASQQRPLLSAKASVSAGGNVHLAMGHRLTAVRFITQSELVDVSDLEIKLTKIASSGTLSLDDGVWSGIGGSTDFSVAIASVGTVHSGQSILDADHTFLLIPQTFTDDSDSRIIVKYVTSGTPKEHSYSLAGQSWQPGHIITFKLDDGSFGDFVFEVDQLAPSSFIPSAGSAIDNYFSVTSYRTVGSVQYPVEWEASEFYYNGSWHSAAPEWLDITTSGDGSSSAAVYPAAATSNDAIAPVWGAEVAATKAEARNLANYDIYGNIRGVSDSAPYETANCYVVSAPGWYKIPAVYGNAYKDGVVNAGAYNSTVAKGTASLLGGAFQNCKDADIKGPWINRSEGENGDGLTAYTSAALLWQDVKGLVTDVSQEGGYVYFRISSSSIARGNAVIALTDNASNVAWNWHVWVVDEPSERLRTSTTYYYTSASMSGMASNEMLAENVGFNPGSGSKDRWCLVRLRQKFSDKTASFYVMQRGTGTDMGAPFYQWGRKDPMCPNAGTSQKTLYDAEGMNVSFGTHGAGNSDCTLGYAISHPKEFITGRSSAYSSSVPNNQGWMYSAKYDNLWNTDVKTASVAGAGNFYNVSVVKTIYDPCPPGFKTPNGFAFSGFNTGGFTKRDHDSVFGLPDSNTFTGLWFFCNPANTEGGLIFFPTQGRRNHGTGALEIGNDYGVTHAGLYWTAAAHRGGSLAYGQDLYFTYRQTQTVENQNSGQARAFPVRPIAD